MGVMNGNVMKYGIFFDEKILCSLDRGLLSAMGFSIQLLIFHETKTSQTRRKEKKRKDLHQPWRDMSGMRHQTQEIRNEIIPVKRLALRLAGIKR